MNNDWSRASLADRLNPSHQDLGARIDEGTANASARARRHAQLDRRADDAVARLHAAPIRSSKERLRVKLYVMLLAIDVTCILFGFISANFLRFHDFTHGPGISLGLGCLPIFGALAFSGGAYSIEVLAAPRLGIRRSLRSLALTTAGLLMALYTAKTAAGVSRIVFASGLAAAGSMMALGRYAFGRFVGERFHWNFQNEVLLIDGVVVTPLPGQIVVFAEQLGVSSTANDPANFSRLGRLLANCDSVMLAASPERRQAWVATLKCSGIAVEILAPELEGLGALRYREVEGRAALLVSVGPLGLKDRMLKRSMDLTISTFGLVLLAPLMLLIAAAIKATSKGPILFRQPRIGRANCIFEVLKFRTMRVETEDHSGDRSTSRDDDRITRVGRILRRTSLDELPQLVNVFTGAMSLVGPRPHALGSTAGERLFWLADSRYWERGAATPGITGLAQVRGYRGATHREEDLVNRVQADLDYLLGWTIWRDLRILAQTAKVLIHPNAY